MAALCYDPNDPTSLMNYIAALEKALIEKDEIIGAQQTTITRLSAELSKFVVPSPPVSPTNQRVLVIENTPTPTSSERCPQVVLEQSPQAQFHCQAEEDALKISLASIPVELSDGDRSDDEFDHPDDVSETASSDQDLNAPPPPPTRGPRRGEPHINISNLSSSQLRPCEPASLILPESPRNEQFSSNNDNVDSLASPTTANASENNHTTNPSTPHSHLSTIEKPSPRGSHHSSLRREPRSSVVFPISNFDPNEKVPPIPSDIYVGLHLGQSELDLVRRQSLASLASKGSQANNTSLSRVNSSTNTNNPASSSIGAKKQPVTPQPASFLHDDLPMTSLTMSLSTLNSNALINTQSGAVLDDWSKTPKYGSIRAAVVGYALPTTDGNATVVDLQGNARIQNIRRSSITGPGTMTSRQIAQAQAQSQAGLPGSNTTTSPTDPLSQTYIPLASPYSQNTLRRRASIACGISGNAPNPVAAPVNPPVFQQSPTTPQTNLQLPKSSSTITSALQRTNSTHSNHSALSITANTPPTPAGSIVMQPSLQRTASTGPPPIPEAVRQRLLSNVTNGPPPIPPPIVSSTSPQHAPSVTVLSHSSSTASSHSSPPPPPPVVIRHINTSQQHHQQQQQQNNLHPASPYPPSTCLSIEHTQTITDLDLDQTVQFRVTSPPQNHAQNSSILSQPLHAPSKSDSSYLSHNQPSQSTTRVMPAFSPIQQPTDSLVSPPPSAVSSHFTATTLTNHDTDLVSNEIDDLPPVPPPPPPPPPPCDDEFPEAPTLTASTSSSSFVTQPTSPVISTQFNPSALQPQMQQRSYGRFRGASIAPGPRNPYPQ